MTDRGTTQPLVLLFDLDGTLLDTDRLHFAAYQELLSGHGRTITMDDYTGWIMGAPNDAIMARLFPDLPVDEHPALSDRKEELFRQTLEGDLEPTRGLLTLLDWAEAKGVSACVVTNAPRPNAEAMLAGLGLQERLCELIIGEELERGKPDPLPYQEGLRRLGAVAEAGLAFEDSGPGVTSASGAGITTYGMQGALSAAALRAAGARYAIRDFTDEGLWAQLASRLAAGAPLEDVSR